MYIYIYGLGIYTLIPSKNARRGTSRHDHNIPRSEPILYFLFFFFCGLHFFLPLYPSPLFLNTATQNNLTIRIRLIRDYNETTPSIHKYV